MAERSREKPPDETQQPADEGTLMMSAGDMPLALRKAPNPALLQTQLMRPGAQPEAPAAIPGSQPPPHHASVQQMGPMGRVPGSQPGPFPGAQPGPGFRGPQQGAPMGPPQVAPPPGGPDPRLVLITEPDSARAASFRLLRDNLLAKRLPRVLAVSSAAKSDGKTICALNLALSLAERAKVLLVDGNILDPELDTIFGISEATPLWPMNAAWLAPYRIAEVSRGLHVAAMVTPYGQPAPRFDKTWFDQVIGALRRFPYDFIIIDTAALSASPTVSQMVAAADATLLAVRSGVTTARVLRRATDQIPEGRAIGIALIDATVRP